MKTVIVVGGGAAGLLASYSAAKKGAKVFLHERNHNFGRKILISGKGRCNLTNAKGLQEMIDNIPGNGIFLNSALNQFPSESVRHLFKNLGVDTKVERGGRVFPMSDNSRDVVRALERAIIAKGVELVKGSRITRILSEGKKIVGVQSECGKTLHCDSVIVATGGLSYPSTGSTGDGYNLASEAGHTIITPRPSLVPMISDAKWIKDLQGLSLKNVEVSLVIGSKKAKTLFGEMLFTHYGVSGPTVITLSRKAVEHMGKPLTVTVNLKPCLTVDQLDRRLLKDFGLFKNKQYKNSLCALLPKKMIPIFVQESGIDPIKQVNRVSKTERLKILQLMTEFKIPIVGFREKEAIVTRGGVSTKEINPKTMESKKVTGLFFAGEVIDVDGFTGGYNLQAAFSTGFIAGQNAAAE